MANTKTFTNTDTTETKKPTSRPKGEQTKDSGSSWASHVNSFVGQVAK